RRLGCRRRGSPPGQCLSGRRRSSYRRRTSHEVSSRSLLLSISRCVVVTVGACRPGLSWICEPRRSPQPLPGGPGAAKTPCLESRKCSGTDVRDGGRVRLPRVEVGGVDEFGAVAGKNGGCDLDNTARRVDGRFPDFEHGGTDVVEL